MIQNYRIFAPNFFNFKIISVLSIFKNIFDSKVFNFTFFCTMPYIYPVGDIRRPADGVEDVAAASTVILWDCGHYGSLWIHPSAVINILPGSGNISTTIQNPKGKSVPITVSRSGCLVGVDNGWLNVRFLPIICVSPE